MILRPEIKVSSLEQLLEMLWTDYTELNPSVKNVFQLFSSANEKVVNDHVAFRTFNYPEMNIDVLSQTFLKYGYEYKDDYHFEEKKLYAKHFEHKNPWLPKIFISELLTEKFPKVVQDILQKLRTQVTPSFLKRSDLCTAGRPWNISHQDYLILKEHSEYAAWMSAYGLRVNHFTVLINELKKFPTIIEVNNLLKKNGHQLNTSGGEIKGTPADFLEQSSTLAYNALVPFSDGNFHIPACYYEFAYRHVQNNGKLFQGFVAKSADKIFESTNKGQ